MHLTNSAILSALFFAAAASAGETVDVPLAKVELTGVNGERLIVEATREKLLRVNLSINGRELEFPSSALVQPILPALSETRLYNCSDSEYAEIRHCYIVEISAAYQEKPESSLQFGVIRFEFHNGRLSKSEIEVEVEDRSVVVSTKHY